MNYRTILLVIASVIVLIAVTFVMYKQSVGKVSQSPKIDEAALQQQIQEIILMGNLSDCPSLSNIQYRLACEHFFASSKKQEQENLAEIKVIETKILTEEESREIFETLPARVQ